LPSALQGHLILAAESWPRLAMQILQSGVSFFIWNLFRKFQEQPCSLED
jgi:hypothetical protein